PQPRPLEVLEPTGEPRADALRRLLAIVDRLRDPLDGCPWDREQTLQSVAPHLVEEAHELVEAVEVRDDAHAIEEAGDLLMGIALLARIAEQEGRFDLSAVAEGVSAKLVRRHPHVFGAERAGSAEQALANWEAIKRSERAEAQVDSSALAGVPAALPALQRARRAAQKAISAGFRWSSVHDALEKLREELGELEAEIGTAGLAGEVQVRPEPDLAARLEHELGDVLLSAAFLGVYLGLDPERAAREALRRFERRFRALESELPGPLAERTPDELLEAWRRAKAAEGGA
ncbi:MAG TPA: nucleoside triphosphate pyrophosphohydrolase, partial [Planctomycetota bacterium]|nr:nucleoside triphosphate pyrophosphohydrolase [Planctomycetota bacterium]